jgi:hypothetical protein
MADRKFVGVFNSSIVQSASMPIGTNPMTETWVPVYTVTPSIALEAGDYIKAFATAEFTNNMGFDVGLVTCLTIDTGPPTANEPISAAGQYLTPPAGDDFGTDNLHHKRVVSIGAIVLTEALPATAVLKLMAAAQSTAATGSSSIQVQPQGYGAMWVEVWR